MSRVCSTHKDLIFWIVTRASTRDFTVFDTSSLFIRKPVADATAAVAEAKWNVAIEDSKEVVMVSKTGHWQMNLFSYRVVQTKDFWTTAKAQRKRRPLLKSLYLGADKQQVDDYNGSSARKFQTTLPIYMIHEIMFSWLCYFATWYRPVHFLSILSWYYPNFIQIKPG